MKILEIRPELVICEDNGIISTRPNSPYYSLRYFYNGGNRIGYIFSDTSYVKETYDDRIFNCWCQGRRLQFRQDLSERLAVAINHHREFGNTEEYYNLFNEAFEEIPDYEMLDLYLSNIDRVLHTKIGYIIYDSFLIDLKGNAWVAKQDSCSPNDHNYNRGIMEDFNSLCIVMQGTSHSSKAHSGYLPDINGNMITVNALTMTILSKIMFLLNPNLEDTGFTSQLSENLLERLREVTGGENDSGK